jgi:uncharacterized protein YutE (UPF0331/DUF86 family)/predicted nucleotidyltransferase
MNIDEKELVKIFKETDGIVATYFFGSQVKGKTDHFSDFDFAVLFKDGWRRDDRWNITGDLLCKAFSVVGQDKADVVDLSEVPIWFQQVVVKTGRVIYETDREERMKYERELMLRCLTEGLPEYVEDGKMKKQDVSSAVYFVNRQINFDTIEENLGMLETLSRFNHDEFMADFRNFQSAVHLLQTSIEALADISRYVIRSLSLPPAQEYWQIPMVLSDAGYIDPKDAEVYVKMFASLTDAFGLRVRFRNLVVHHYYRVNPEDIYRIVTKELDYIRRWRDTLLKIIEEQTNT